MLKLVQHHPRLLWAIDILHTTNLTYCIRVTCWRGSAWQMFCMAYVFLQVFAVPATLSMLRDIALWASILFISRNSPSAQGYVLAGFCMAYIFMQAFAVPGTLSLSLLAGALFGATRGLFVVAGARPTQQKAPFRTLHLPGPAALASVQFSDAVTREGNRLLRRWVGVLSSATDPSPCPWFDSLKVVLSLGFWSSETPLDKSTLLMHMSVGAATKATKLQPGQLKRCLDPPFPPVPCLNR